MNGIRHHLKWIVLTNACIFVLVLSIVFRQHLAKIWVELSCIENIIGIFSIIIAIIAGVVAYIACFSIDAVKMITNMDGNVLDNENYSNLYPDVFEKFKKIEESEGYTNILSDMVSEKRKIHDCIEFALHIQRFIDTIVWVNFAALDVGRSSSCRMQHECEKKIIKLANKAKKFEKENSGLENTFDENIKLIIAILKMYFGEEFMESKQFNKRIHCKWYNKYRYRNLKTGEKNCIGSIYNVRGQIFINPITQITYYNYLGAKFVEAVLGESVHKSHALCLEKMRDIFNDKDNSKDKKEILLRKAAENLKYAQEKSEKNMLWNCICSENLIKVQIIEWLISGAQIDKCVKLHKKITDTKAKWENIYYIFKEIGDIDDDSYIMKEFKKRKQELNNITKNIKDFMALK